MMQDLPSTNQYLTMRQLRERGWTERLVRSFLGGPDDCLPNPHINGGYPKRLYLLNKVEKIERDNQEFIFQKKRSKKCSLRLQEARNKVRQNLEALVRATPLPYFCITFDEVLVQATSIKNTNPGYQFQSVKQVALTILLDTMKSMGSPLDLYMGHPGVREARIFLVRRMLAHIINHYPQLAEAALNRAFQENGSANNW